MSNVDILMREGIINHDLQAPQNFGTNPDAPDGLVEGSPFSRTAVPCWCESSQKEWCFGDL